VQWIALAATLLALQAPVPLPAARPWTDEVAATLQSLGEPSLAAGAERQTTVRLVISPAHLTLRTVVVRVTAEASGAEVVTKVLSNRYPGPSVPYELPTLHASAERWAEVEGLLGPGLWSFHPRPFPDPLIADGEAWFVEAIGRRGYMSLVQHSPGPGAFRSLCQALLRLSSIDYSANEYVSWLAWR
jgi:hypothetical protein